MVHTPTWKRWLLGLALAAGAATSASAQPTPAQLLTFKPNQPDVAISTPTTEEIPNCKVELVKAPNGGSGWRLLDPAGRPLRCLFDSNGDRNVDQWSYYRDGIEVYREVDTKNKGKADQYRWLNSGGMKWGVSTAADGRIDRWSMISSEEVAQEAYLALASRNFDRLKALFITESEMQALKLPAAEVKRLTTLQQGAAKKFADVLKTLPALDKATFVRVESATPMCILAEQFGGDTDQIRHQSRTILFETADKKHEWLFSGEMIQVGMAWRLVDGPSREDTSRDPIEPHPITPPLLRKLLTELAELDEAKAKNPAMKLEDYLTRRIGVVERIVAEPGADRENFIKQIFDNASTGAEAGSKELLARLTNLSKQMVQQMPGSNLAAYGVYREMWTQYSLELQKVQPQEVPALQERWIKNLTGFVGTYPKSEDAASAIEQIALSCEFSGKDEEAKRWYTQIVDGYPNAYQTKKARGSIDRLSLVGKEMVLRTTTLGTGAPFDIASLKGKVVIVYYWATNCSQCIGDFARLKRLHGELAAKNNIELVSISLDDSAEAATAYLKTNPMPGVHLFEGSAEKGIGLNSPLALQYGINGLPTMFLVGRDGKVVNRSLMINDLETELKKVN